MAAEQPLSHLTKSGAPTMVDVSQKDVTRRTACAQALVRFPPDVADVLRANSFRSKKGSVFDVAIVAGTMAVKHTADTIPFCHQLPVEKCDFAIEMVDDLAVVTCEVSVEAKTGVEMEALHGASVAALTIYDMCKALSHNITIESVKLLQKTGGKS
jgi:cyclic pyranopterin phosphate synthase